MSATVRWHGMLTLGLSLTAAVVLAGCAGMGANMAPRASASLDATKGNSVSGTVKFTQRGAQVLVEADVRGLAPNREHGFHIHDKGDCSSGDGMSTGGHFNPFAKPHAHHETSERHAGDMPALKADAQGNAKLRVELDVMSLNDGPASIIGRGLIVHKDPDDYRTQPTGNAGARLACAVIRRD